VVLVEQVVNLAAEAGSESCLEKQQRQARGADDQVDWTDDVVEDYDEDTYLVRGDFFTNSKMPLVCRPKSNFCWRDFPRPARQGI